MNPACCAPWYLVSPLLEWQCIMCKCWDNSGKLSGEMPPLICVWKNPPFWPHYRTPNGLSKVCCCCATDGGAPDPGSTVSFVVYCACVCSWQVLYCSTCAGTKRVCWRTRMCWLRCATRCVRRWCTSNRKASSTETLPLATASSETRMSSKSETSASRGLHCCRYLSVYLCISFIKLEHTVHYNRPIMIMTMIVIINNNNI